MKKNYLLIVTDVNRLAPYGFKPNGHRNDYGREIWVKDIAINDFDSVQMIVNPNCMDACPNELVMVFGTEIDKNLLREFTATGYDSEQEIPLGSIMNMLADRVLLLKAVNTRKELEE